MTSNASAAADVTLFLSEIHDIEFCPACKMWTFTYGDLDKQPGSSGVARIYIGDNNLMAAALQLDHTFRPQVCAPCGAKHNGPTEAGIR